MFIQRRSACELTPAARRRLWIELCSIPYTFKNQRNLTIKPHLPIKYRPRVINVRYECRAEPKAKRPPRIDSGGTPPALAN